MMAGVVSAQGSSLCSGSHSPESVGMLGPEPHAGLELSMDWQTAVRGH